MPDQAAAETSPAGVALEAPSWQPCYSPLRASRTYGHACGNLPVQATSTQRFDGGGALCLKSLCLNSVLGFLHLGQAAPGGFL